MNFKLNYKKVLSVGIVFMFITAFWYGYNSIVPKILTDKFGLSQTVSGAVMALDNIVALFLLHTAINERQLNIFNGSKACNQVKALENEADFLVADFRKLIIGKSLNILTVKKVFTACRYVKKTEHIHKCGLT